METSESHRSLIQTINQTGYQYGYNYSVWRGTNSFITQADVSEIDFKNGKITFEYTVNNSFNLLNKIHVFNNVNGSFTEVKQWVFYQSLFSGATSFSSFRLDSLREVGGSFASPISNPPYSFNYFSYGSYQRPLYYSYAQDFWGYFNGQINNQDLIFVAPPVPIGNGTNLPVVSAAYKRTPDSNYLKVGTLQSIKYPTGGSTLFDLEPNQTTITYTHYDTTKIPVTGYVTESQVNYIPTVQFTVSANLLVSFDPINGNPYNWKLDFTGYHMCSGGGNCIYNDPTVVLKDITSGVTVAQITLSQLNNASPPPSAEYIGYLTLTTGHTYQLYFLHPVTKTGSQTYQNRLDATGSGASVGTITSYPVTQPVLTGGLRVRKITSSDAFGGTVVKEYKYTQSYYNSQLFNGSYDQVALTNFVFQGYNKDALHVDGAGCAIFLPRVSYYSENLSLPLGSVNNNGISYSEVEEYQSDGNGNYLGKTVYDYNTAFDILTPSMPFFKIDNEYLRYLINQKIYKYSNGNYSLLKNISNQYLNIDTLLKIQADSVRFYTAHALVDNWTTDPANGGVGSGGAADACLGCTGYSYFNQYLINKFYYTSPKYVLKSSTTTDFDDAGNQMLDSVTYDYSNAVHIMPTHKRSISSKGFPEDIYTQYVLDYPYSSCSNTAWANFIQQLNVLKSNLYSSETAPYNKFTTYRARVGPSCTALNSDSVTAAEAAYNTAEMNFQTATNSASSLISNYNAALASYNSCVTGYYNTASIDQKGIMDLQNQNNILPQLQITQYNNSVLNSTLQTFYKTYRANVTQPSRVMFSTLNNPLENRLQYLSYDPHSKVKELSKTNDLLMSYLWDYNNTYPIAEVKNADSSSIAYTSFEADGAGNWILPSSGNSFITDTTSPTGTRYMQLSASNNISISGLNNTKTYTVSYWSKSGSWTVNGSSAGKTGKTVNGWTYYEHTVTNPGSITVSGSSGFSIDELRLYPVGSLMTTYTYAPLIGMTSQCDINNRITYYVYDGLGRLRVIKDQDKNIIKKFDYQYEQTLQQSQ